MRKEAVGNQIFFFPIWKPALGMEEGMAVQGRMVLRERASPSHLFMI